MMKMIFNLSEAGGGRMKIMAENMKLTGNQKTGLIACVGMVALTVVGVMAYVVPECVKLISEA